MLTATFLALLKHNNWIVKSLEKLTKNKKTKQNKTPVVDHLFNLYLYIEFAKRNKELQNNGISHKDWKLFKLIEQVYVENLGVNSPGTRPPYTWPVKSSRLKTQGKLD